MKESDMSFLLSHSLNSPPSRNFSNKKRKKKKTLSLEITKKERKMTAATAMTSNNFWTQTKLCLARPAKSKTDAFLKVALAVGLVNAAAAAGAASTALVLYVAPRVWRTTVSAFHRVVGLFKFPETGCVSSWSFSWPW